MNNGPMDTGSEQELVQLVSNGELSTGKLVELLGITYHDVPALAEKYGVEIGATGEQSRYALEQYGHLVRKSFKVSSPD